MRFGTYYFLQRPPGASDADVIRTELEQMVWSEALGFDSVWVGESLVARPRVEPLSALAAIAAVAARRGDEREDGRDSDQTLEHPHFPRRSSAILFPRLLTRTGGGDRCDAIVTGRAPATSGRSPPAGVGPARR